MVQVRQVKFELREGTAAEWTARNPTLRAGEPGYERDTNKMKIGNGSTPWNSLGYLTGAGSEGPAGDSAYEVAVDNGFVGTEAEWLTSLEGAPGANGTNGTNGIDGQDGLDGAEGQSAYEVAQDNGFVGNEAAWLASLIGPAGANGTDGVDGEDGLPGPSGEVYPLAAAGFVSASVSLTDVLTSSSSGPWVARLWVPPNESFSQVGCYVSVSGAAGNTLNAFALYDDAGNLITQTPNNNNLWVPGGWTMESFPSTIAAQGTGRFVFVAIAMNGSSPELMYFQNPSQTVYNGIISGHRRSWVGPSRNAGFPSSINVATEGTVFSYIPLIVLA